MAFASAMTTPKVNTKYWVRVRRFSVYELDGYVWDSNADGEIHLVEQVIGDARETTPDPFGVLFENEAQIKKARR